MIAGWVLYEEREDESAAETKLRHIEECRRRLVASGQSPGQAVRSGNEETWDETLGRFVDIFFVEFE